VAGGLDAEAAGGCASIRPTATPAFPLALSPASEKTISATLGELRERVVSVSSIRTMRPTLIEDGDTVRVWNALGECIAWRA
jgi:hypothetical protein